MNARKDSVRSSKIAGMPLKAWTALVIEFVLLAALLFGSAGTVNWPTGWVFLTLLILSIIPIGIGLAKHDPDLLDERMKFIHADQPLWDRVLLTALRILIFAWFAVPGFDVRFGWSRVPLGLQIVGGIAMPMLLYFQYMVMRQNTFLAPTVKMQEERGHTVISTGAYAIVRHPFYATIVPFFPAVGLLLDSWWAVVLSLLVIVLLAYRAVKEERYLKHELNGYAEYMKNVRFRLVPYVW